MRVEAARYRLDQAYEEDVVLYDGVLVRLRLVRPSDKATLARGFERLSPESRYRRFLSPKPSLSAEELRYLTEVDGIDHFAIGAVKLMPDGGEEGLAIARFVRLKSAPEVAEAAIAVVDHAQRKGLGRNLLDRLAAAASERGIKRFRCEVLASNVPIQRLLSEIGTPQHAEIEGGAMSIEVSLAEGAPADTRGGLHGLLGLAARGVIVVRNALGDLVLRGSNSIGRL